MTTANREDDYFLWLILTIRGESHKEFRSLLKRLNSLSFYSLVEYDDNRALDGLRFREIYLTETHREPPVGNCTVLEVLIGIAERMSYVLYDPDLESEDQIYIWFWQLIENLHLDPKDDYYRNEEKINTWLERRYAYNGHGGLFPLKDPIDDQREVEIWYQMQAYLNEILL